MAVYQMLFKTSERIGIGEEGVEGVSRKGYVVDPETMQTISPEMTIYSFLNHNPIVEEPTDEEQKERYRVLNSGKVVKIRT